ncbi:adenylate/guanylate cyclase domain-containing protein [Pseudobowmanella zhangzhouensis]|uniref:Adenylate/guanylate cyclase domain-containing protein n=2 Tax=Alteromonadales TaxID=135622 RepID=A0ABW1XP46_9ALTE
MPDIFIFLLLGLVALFAIIIWRLSRRVRSLDELYRKVLHNSANTPSKSESDAEMMQQISAQLDEAQQVSRTFEKFVPNQFFAHLSGGQSGKIELGNAIEDEVAILFCDVRGFSRLSEQMSPQELLNFLNSYFERINQPIHEYGGFIDKFIGDAVMALFDHPQGTAENKCRDAISAALAMRDALNLYNQHRANCNYPPINIGIGVHFGPVILGTVGSKDRMDSTVLGDVVNTASRLEALTPTYNADIIVSAQTLEASGLGDSIDYRLLDWVRVKGKQRPVKIYELLGHLPENVRKQRLSIAPLIEKGIEHRIAQRWDEAIHAFQQAVASQPQDSVINHHLSHCYRMRGQLLPPDWDGALDV